MAKKQTGTYESFDDNMDAQVERVIPNAQALSDALRWAQTRLRPAPVQRAKSTAESPVRVAWDIFEQMQGERRKDVIATAVAAGVNENTAKTQYQRWFKSQKEV